MKLRDRQSFLSLYYEPNAVEVATGEADSFASAGSWQRETKQLGQVATPEPVAALMARWVMAVRPSAVLDPAAGLGGLLAACHQLNREVAMVGVDRDTETLKLAKATAPRSQCRDHSVQRLPEPGAIRLALRHFPPSKVNRSLTSTLRTLANFSKPATDGAFTPRSTRLMNSTEQSTASASCSWVSFRSRRRAATRCPSFR